MSDLGVLTNVFAKAQEEANWLAAHPDFEERPATLDEFLGPDYLNCRKYIRKRIVKELREIIGSEVNPAKPTKYEEAIITGGIGIGKTTIASIVLPYLVHWTLCLKDPQDFFGLLPGTRIAFMQMSTTEKQALQVIFTDLKARINYAPWFRDPKHQYNQDMPTRKNQMRFEKDIWIIPGDSRETTFEGYNILGGIIDEADSHMVTETKDYAEQGYSTIQNRITSRFGDRGFLLVIGQMKSSSGFAARTYERMMASPKAYAVRLAIWESLGDEHWQYEKDEHGNCKKFIYDVFHKQFVPRAIVEQLGPSDNYIYVPEFYRDRFEYDAQKALKDLAGMPPAVNDPFIGMPSRISAARERWVENHAGQSSPVDERGILSDSFYSPDTLERVAHLDIAYASGGDSYGIAMGHVPRVVERDSELKPYIVIDMLMRMKAPPGGEIFLGDARQLLYLLRDERRFRLKTVTMDGCESTDTRQQLKRARFRAEEVSVDREKLPYHDLREALYEERIEFPPYIVMLRRHDGRTEKCEILYKELSELVDTGKKIDHPVPHGSKDVADAVAGVVSTLMGDRRYRRGRKSDFTQPPADSGVRDVGVGLEHPAYRGDLSVSAPLPPNQWRP